MALSIKSERADRMARELAEITGESITEAVTEAIRAKLEGERLARFPRRSALDLAVEFRSLSVLDARAADEIVGYDSDGLPS